jgi:predicted nucleotidyltransferase
VMGEDGIRYALANCGLEELLEVAGVRELVSILKEIKDYVIVTGSYAEGTQTEESDIDFYIKPIPEDEVDLEAWRVIDTYCEKLMKIFKDRGLKVGSVFVTTFHCDETFIPLEFSAYYNIDEKNIFPIEILGVTMNASKSTYVEEGKKR